MIVFASLTVAQYHLAHWFFGTYFVALGLVSSVLPVPWLMVQFAWDLMTIYLLPKAISILGSAKVTACEFWEGAIGFSVQLPDTPTTILRWVQPVARWARAQRWYCTATQSRE